MKMLSWIEFLLGAFTVSVGFCMFSLGNGALDSFGGASLIVSGLYVNLKADWVILREWNWLK